MLSALPVMRDVGAGLCRGAGLAGGRAVRTEFGNGQVVALGPIGATVSTRLQRSAVQMPPAVRCLEIAREAHARLVQRSDGRRRHEERSPQ